MYKDTTWQDDAKVSDTCASLFLSSGFAHCDAKVRFMTVLDRFPRVTIVLNEEPANCACNCFRRSWTRVASEFGDVASPRWQWVLNSFTTPARNVIRGCYSLSIYLFYSVVRPFSSHSSHRCDHFPSFCVKETLRESDPTSRAILWHNNRTFVLVKL